MNRTCIIGRYIAKEFIINIDEEINLFIGVVKSYNQQAKTFDVFYDADGTTEQLTATELNPLLKLFES